MHGIIFCNCVWLGYLAPCCLWGPPLLLMAPWVVSGVFSLAPCCSKHLCTWAHVSWLHVCRSCVRGDLHWVCSECIHFVPHSHQYLILSDLFIFASVSSVLIVVLINILIIKEVEHIFLHLLAIYVYWPLSLLLCKVPLQAFCPSFCGVRLSTCMSLVSLCHLHF